jgi:hypothetical protein
LCAKPVLVNSGNTFRFTAIDPNGAPRSGAVAAHSAQEAAAKLAKRGFTSVLVEQETRALKQAPSIPRREASGYQPTAQDRLDEFTSKDSRLKGVAAILVCLGLVMLVVLWPSGPEVSLQPTATQTPKTESVRAWTVEARIEDWNPEDQIVFSVPTVPYSWSQPASELGEGGVFRQTMSFESKDISGEAVLSLSNGKTGEQRAERRLELDSATELLDFGLLRPDHQ